LRFAATVLFGGLDNAVVAYRKNCQKVEKPVQKIKCSCFIDIGDGEDERQRALARMVGHITMAGLRRTMGQGGKGGLPPTMEYFKKIGERINDARAFDFEDNSLLYGSPQQIIDNFEAGRGYRHRRGHPLLQLRQPTRRLCARADAPVHGRHRGRPRRLVSGVKAAAAE
jgi:hypothetical protein